MTIREFVEYVWANNSINPSENITIDDAKCDLRNFETDGWDLPEDITAEEYACIYNELVDNYNKDE